MNRAYNYSATYEEYLKLIEEEKTAYEYLDGCIYALASGTYEHCSIQGQITGCLYMALQGKSCKVAIELDLHTSTKDFLNQVVRPDIMVICDKENVEDGKYSGVPTIVVEVVSPSSRSNDYFLKANLYNLIGVKEYYVVDPMHKKITVFIYDNLDFEQRIYQNDDIIQSSMFEEVKINLKDVFKQ